MNITRDEVLYPKVTEEQIGYLRQAGEECTYRSGEVIFAEGEPADNMFIVLEGQIRVTRRVGSDESLIVVHGPGEFTGELSLLTGGLAVASGRAEGECRTLRIDSTTFRQLLGRCTPLTNTLVQALATRRQDVDALAQQREKLQSLGLMAAGLAHELNNPAGAALSAVQTLRTTFHDQQALTLSLHRSMSLTPDQHACLIELACTATEHDPKETPLDPIAQSEREDELADWLFSLGVDNGYDLAPTFVSSGLDPDKLSLVPAKVNPGVLCDVFSWLEATLKMRNLMSQIESATGRVAKLVTSVKKYSFMDQAPIQEIDVHEGLEDTLTMLSFKLKKYAISVDREYAQDVPRICAFGSELNQAWTNLIINAIDALDTLPTGSKRHLRVRTCTDGPDHVIVEIEDNGPGIPEAIQDRIFDPFFTTKDVGKGTGMGLDITHRIIVKRHHGEIQVDSEPGRTCFKIRLPVRPVK